MEADTARHHWSSRSIQLHHSTTSHPPHWHSRREVILRRRERKRQTQGRAWQRGHPVSTKTASLPCGDSIALRGKRRDGLPSSRCMLASQQRRGTGEPTAFRRTVPLFRSSVAWAGCGWRAGRAPLRPLADAPSEPGLSQLGLWLSHLSAANHRPSSAPAEGTYHFLPQAICPFRNTWPKDKSTQVSHLLPCPSRCLLRQHLAICPLDTTHRTTPTIRFYLESPPAPT